MPKKKQARPRSNPQPIAEEAHPQLSPYDCEACVMYDHAEIRKWAELRVEELERCLFEMDDEDSIREQLQKTLWSVMKLERTLET
jgi:hypothetical protein